MLSPFNSWAALHCNTPATCPAVVSLGYSATYLQPGAIKAELDGQALPVQRVVERKDLFTRHSVSDADVLVGATARDARSIRADGAAQHGPVMGSNHLARVMGG